MLLRSGALALLLTVCGCHLVDQRDFDAAAGRKPVPRVAAAKPVRGPDALVVISYAQPDPDYAAGLAVAVRHALQLKPGVVFSVQVREPPAGGPQAQAQALGRAAATGREIAEAITADGADSGQVDLAVRTDAAVKAREVDVFVR